MREPWLTKRELARELRVSTRTVTRLKLPHARVGGQNRYRLGEVEAALRELHARSGPSAAGAVLRFPLERLGGSAA